MLPFEWEAGRQGGAPGIIFHLSRPQTEPREIKHTHAHTHSAARGRDGREAAKCEVWRREMDGAAEKVADGAGTAGK